MDNDLSSLYFKVALFIKEKLKLALPNLDSGNHRMHLPGSTALIDHSSLLSSSTPNPNLRNLTSAAFSPIWLKPENSKMQAPIKNLTVDEACEKGVSELQIHLVAGRVGLGVGYALISQGASFMSECKDGKVGEFQTLVLQETDLEWEDIQHACCQSVVCENLMFLLGGSIHKLQVDHFLEQPQGCEDVHMIDIEADTTNRRWTRAPYMSGEHISHAAICVDQKIYVFGGNRVYSFMTSFDGEENKMEYTPWAEVYDLKEMKWSNIEFPTELAMRNPTYLIGRLHCCLVDTDNAKKILLFNCLDVFAYDLGSGVWLNNYIEKKKINRINPYFLHQVLQSGNMLFFITTDGWWVFNLLNMEMLDDPVFGLFEMEDELPLPKVRYEFGHRSSKVMSLGYSAGVHDFVIFYEVRNGDDMYIYVARIAVTEYFTRTSCVASLNSFGRFLLKDCVCKHFYAVA